MLNLAQNMKISEYSLSITYYHVAVFLYGVTAILGKMISYGSLLLVWHRMVITFLVYIMIPEVRTEILRLSWRQRMNFFCIGLVVCFTWLTFYWSIELGDSASVTLSCLGSVTFFAAIFEPMFLGVPFSRKDVFAGVLVLLGIMQIFHAMPQSSSSPGTQYGWAIIFGTISSMLNALYSVLNKLCIKESTPLAISAMEMFSGAALLTVIVPLVYGEDTMWFPRHDISKMTLDTLQDGPWDLVWVLLLSLVCTNLAFFLANKALIHVRAFTINLILNLEPVYGIVLGAVIFHENEQLNYHFYMGTGIILLTIFASAFFGDGKCNSCSTGTELINMDELPNEAKIASPVQTQTATSRPLRTVVKNV